MNNETTKYTLEYYQQKEANKRAKMREYYRKMKYGISQERYDYLLESQQGKCAICYTQTKLIADHNEKAGIVRGLLCQQCRKGIVAFKQSTELLQNALQYVA